MRRFEYNGAKICVFENNFSSDELYQKFEQPENYLEELNHISGEKRKKEFLGLRFCLKNCINSEEKVFYTTDGKPFLENSDTKISFSHTSHWNAVIAHPFKNVGIDIEKPSEKLSRIRSKFMNRQEVETFGENPSQETLCLIWSAKESLYKIIGNEAIDFRFQLQILKISETKIEAKHLVTNKNFNLEYVVTPEFILVYGTE